MEYDPNPHGCGPSYRDWAGEESCFVADGADVAPGIRICGTRPRTILDGDHTDRGDFRGVAIFSTGSVTTLITELRAGWYRYVSEVRLHADGTIGPRFGFAAVQNPCTCSGHRHHAYWRLDFDLGGAGSQRVEEVDARRAPTLLRHHPDELDDNAIGRSDAAALDELATPPEPVVDTEVVLWYAVHRSHTPGANHFERLGPTLRPII